jgi:hypothetical protein
MQHVPNNAEITPDRKFQPAAERRGIVVGKAKTSGPGEIGSEREVTRGWTYAHGLD